MKKRFQIPSFFILLAVLAWLPANSLAAGAANRWQSHAAILGSAQSFLEAFTNTRHQGHRSEIRLGKLDSRLRVKPCDAGLEAFMSPGGRTMGNTTVGVRCPDPGGWSLYVTARIDVFGPVLVARQPLARGTAIQETDLELVERNLSDMPYGYYTASQSIEGQLAKRTITSATVITPQMLQAPNLVKRGQRVTLIVETGPLKIRSTGKAMNDGKSGDLVSVKSDGSLRTVDGIVISPGVIKVAL